jgi:DNA-binding transcriptional ArsR family regulator
MTVGPPPISEPERVRALAHPVRLALLDHLEQSGEATATRCAEAIGESVASCSFHLRILAKYGFIEPGRRRGREKPWRVVSRERTAQPDFDDPASVRAVGALAELTVLAESERIRAFLADIHRLPPDLRDGVGVLKAAIWATPEELQQLSRDVLALIERFTGRWEDPAQRPPGARVARVFAVLNPELDHPGQEAPR